MVLAKGGATLRSMVVFFGRSKLSPLSTEFMSQLPAKFIGRTTGEPYRFRGGAIYGKGGAIYGE